MGGGAAAFALIAALAVALSVFAPGSGVSAAPQEHCPGDVKVEGHSAVIDAPHGEGIEYVCIKAGNDLFIFQCGDPGDDCYHIDWIYDGCFYAASVEVTGGGTSRYCKEISYVTAKFIDCD
jgi:hypothetical protein